MRWRRIRLPYRARCEHHQPQVVDGRVLFMTRRCDRAVTHTAQRGEDASARAFYVCEPCGMELQADGIPTRLRKGTWEAWR